MTKMKDRRKKTLKWILIKIRLHSRRENLDKTEERMSDEAETTEKDLQLVTHGEASLGWLAKVKLVAASAGLFVCLTASFVAAACDVWLRKQRSILRKLKHRLIAPSVSLLSSPSITDGETHRNRLGSVVEALTKPIASTGTKWFPRKSAAQRDSEPEKSVHVEILHDPSPAPIRADVIFIHGLHGSLFNTWKQGLWSHRKKVQNLPLEHKYKIRETSDHLPGMSTANEDKPSVKGGRIVREGRGQSVEDHDHLLENITDLINNLDDKLKMSQNGAVDTETEEYTQCWPRDWLPKDCPGVRVIAVNYTTDPFLWRPFWITKRIRTSMPERSQQMEDPLLKIGVGRRPIIWVGHSKGGLFVKQMLVDASMSRDPDLAALLEQTKGIMFYSVPHRGSSLARWNLPLLRQSIEVKEVKKDCREVLELHQKFLSLYEEKSLTAEVFSFVETILTSMWVTNVRVVTVDSADLGLGSFRGVNIDHREICKPLNRDCFLYKELTSLIERVL